jgi:hypothetical protein
VAQLAPRATIYFVRALAITAQLLGINLRNITFEEENKRGSLHNSHPIESQWA